MQFRIVFALAIGFSLSAMTVKSEQNPIFIIPFANQNSEQLVSVKFDAEEFFTPIAPDQDRSNYPEKLTIESIVNPFSIEEMKSKLKSSLWKTAHHCDGYAIHQEKFYKTNFADGYYNPSLVLEFIFDDQLIKRHIIPKKTAMALNTDFLDFDLLIITNENYDLENLFPFKLNFLGYADVSYRLVKIKETGEYLIESNQQMTFNSENKICPNGEMPKVLFIPFEILSS